MVSTQTLQGHWNEIQGKIRSKWGQLTSDDLSQFNGNVDQLIGMIQRKTGEAKERIEHYLTELTEEGGEGFTGATEAVREYTQKAAKAVSETSKQAADSMREGYNQAAEQVKHGYEEAEKIVKERPIESMLVVFGTGLLVGVCMGLMARSR
jgi:uncharacterized protein YjbJ (UPF0337 family)